MIKGIITKVYYIISVLIIVWLIYSFYDVVSNNLSTCEYWRYNAFIILSKLRK